MLLYKNTNYTINDIKAYINDQGQVGVNIVLASEMYFEVCISDSRDTVILYFYAYTLNGMLRIPISNKT